MSTDVRPRSTGIDDPRAGHALRESTARFVVNVWNDADASVSHVTAGNVKVRKQLTRITVQFGTYAASFENVVASQWTSHSEKRHAGWRPVWGAEFGEWMDPSAPDGVSRFTGPED